MAQQVTTSSAKPVPPPTAATAAAIQPGFPQSVAVTVQMPPEKTDITGDLVSGGIGLVGALVGALAAYQFGLRAAKLASKALEDERDKFAAFSVIHKLGLIYTAQTAIYLHMKEATERVKTMKFNPHVSMAMKHLANLPQRVAFNTDEVYRVGSFAGKDVLNTLMMLDSQHNSTIDHLTYFTAEKAAFRRHIKGDVQGDVIVTGWTKAEYKAVEPQVLGMDQMVGEMLRYSEGDMKGAHDTIVAIVKARGPRFGDKSEYKLRGLDGKDEFVKPDPAPKPKFGWFW